MFFNNWGSQRNKFGATIIKSFFIISRSIPKQEPKSNCGQLTIYNWKRFSFYKSRHSLPYHGWSQVLAQISDAAGLDYSLYVNIYENLKEQFPERFGWSEQETVIWSVSASQLLLETRHLSGKNTSTFFGRLEQVCPSESIHFGGYLLQTEET